MRLLFTPTAPFPRKVLVVAHELGIADRIQLIPVRPTEDFDLISKENPLGKIPVLTTPDGMTLYDSNVICAWLDDTFGESRLQRTDADKWSVLRDVALADGILEAGSLVRKEGLRPAALRSAAVINRECARIHSALAAFEQAAIDFDAPITLSRLTLACAVDWLWFRLPETEWTAELPRVSSAVRVLLTRESLSRTDPRRA